MSSNGAFIAAESTEYGKTWCDRYGAKAVYTPVEDRLVCSGHITSFVQCRIGANNNDETGYRFYCGSTCSLAWSFRDWRKKFKYDDVYNRKRTAVLPVALRYYVTKNFSIGANYDIARINGNDQKRLVCLR